MAAPNVTITAEPKKGRGVAYLRLAAKTTAHTSQAQLSLRLSVKNDESSKLAVKKLDVSYPGSSVPSDSTGVDLSIAPGETERWFFPVDANQVFDRPAPKTVRLEMHFHGFGDPAVLTLRLAPHLSPTKEGSYRFPAHSTDLRPGELWRGRSAKHGPAGDGGQMFAYDVDVVAWQDGAWSKLLPKTSGDENEHYRCYGKRIYAMADGTVVDFLDTMAENTEMGKQEPTPNPVEGNHFYVQHGDELMLYAHFQPGSLNAKLKTKGAAVAEGDFLGISGNSGNSTNPHLHIHCIKATQPWAGPARPLPFHASHVVEWGSVTPPDLTGPWVEASDEGLPAAESLIWPYRKPPVWREPDPEAPKAVAILRSGDWASRYLQGLTRQAFLDETQELFDDHGLRLTRIKTYLDHGERRWAGICQSGTWANRLLLGLSLADFLEESQELFDEKGLRLVQVETWVEGGQRLWGGIARAGDWASRLLVERSLQSFLDETQELFDDKGLRLVNVVSYKDGNTRKWAGICRSGNWASRLLVERSWSRLVADSQELFDEKGLRLIDVTTYEDGGQRKWAGIARGGTWANRLVACPNLVDFLDRTQRWFDEKGLRLADVEIY